MAHEMGLSFSLVSPQGLQYLEPLPTPSIKVTMGGKITALLVAAELSFPDCTWLLAIDPEVSLVVGYRHVFPRLPAQVPIATRLMMSIWPRRGNRRIPG